MPGAPMGMELWAIVPELILAGLVLVLLPIGPFLSPRQTGLTTGIGLVGLLVAAVASAAMLTWPAQSVFLGTFAVDPFAAFFKLIAIGITTMVLLATESYFRGRPNAASVPAVLVLTCLGLVGLAASQDLALIALFLQLMTLGSYVLVGLAKDERRATEGALKLFLFSAAANAVMLYGMSLLYGLTGSLRLAELAAHRPAGAGVALLVALGLMLVGYAFEITLAPVHLWAPDTYQGAPPSIAGFLSVGPKAAGLAVMLRTLVVAFPDRHDEWAIGIAVVSAVTMTVGNLSALRQTSVKRLLAYSSIGQAGYLVVGIAAAGRDRLAVPGMLFYLLVYASMNLAAFLAVDALERPTGSDDLESFAGLGIQRPLVAATLAVALLSLAGIPPFGGFVGKAMLLGAALAAGWGWLAVVMVVNVGVSLSYYLRVLEVLYFRGPSTAGPAAVPVALRVVLVILAAGTLVTGVAPQPWVALARQAAEILGGQALR